MQDARSLRAPDLFSLFAPITWRRWTAPSRGAPQLDRLPVARAAAGCCLMTLVRYTHGMSTRLQVLLDEKELRDFRRLAKQQGVTVSEWVRQALREARRRMPAENRTRKLAVVRAATKHGFPAPDMAVMLAEIEQGYATGMPK